MGTCFGRIKTGPVGGRDQRTRLLTFSVEISFRWLRRKRWLCNDSIVISFFRHPMFDLASTTA